MSDLFRKEVIENRRGSWLGSISLVQPLRMWLLASLAAVAGGLVLFFLFFGEYTRRSRVAGELVPDLGLSTVVASAPGVVTALHAEEGQHVSAQAPLVLLSAPRVTASGQDALEILRSQQEAQQKSLIKGRESQNEQVRLQHVGLTRQREALQKELSQIAGEIESRRAQVRIAQDIVERYRKVSDARYVSILQLNQQEQSVLELINAQKALERQATTINRTLAQVEQALAELPKQQDSANAAISRELALLAKETIQVEANGEMLLRAPVKGLVANRLVEVGHAVQTGQPVLTLLPEGSELRAQLMVPSSAIGFIKPGDRVLLRYQAYPYQKFGTHSGRVLRISRSAVIASKGQADEGEAVYRVLVSLNEQTVLAYGQPEALRPGMRLEADVMGERRRLYEWVLEPLYSVVGKASGS
ncbi:HlyD family efflux transporter periplasmic adaptor subunit [Stenotrophomonas pavanii]|uniref:HlyD family secretion protein n=1 Tax=Stenotrophomonas pavanii TaxID=487698 RepID=UPI00089265E2|nr:HlyD family efflux transporter periplasmic adaptor subunit [Stenotrophomonas pavanii]PNY70818.1 hemolysin D [Stenotrophomonas pavanii]SDK40994.1 membrane fusion protein [Stenotrophomonas pavanii]